MRILLVEDERRMAQALCEILRVEKYEVDHYADGISGLEALESGLYDLAVLDVMLPGRDGFEVVREARKKGLRTPIIMPCCPWQTPERSFLRKREGSCLSGFTGWIRFGPERTAITALGSPSPGRS